MHIRRWETHLYPRQVAAFSSSADVTQPTDTFGDVGGVEKIDNGWLTTETLIQFKFFANPFHLKQKLKNRLLYVKLTPMNLRIADETTGGGGGSVSGSVLSGGEDSLSLDHRGSSSGGGGGSSETTSSSYAIAEVVTLKYPHSVIEPQQQFGRAYNHDDILMFNVIVSEPDNIAYLIDLYTYSSRHEHDEPPVHLGYHFILPNLLRRSDAMLEIPITCAARHRPLGMMNIEYLKVTPLIAPALSEMPQTMRCSYLRHWNRKWTGLDVGHRGSGSSFKQGLANIRENTIASLKQAADAGADMVEFDVQLSKDLVPVIYHDFIVYVALKQKKTMTETDMLQMPMKDLTLEQLNNLKVYHAVEGRAGAARFFDEDLEDHQPFPQLADALQSIDMSVGFNIEVKWSMLMADGTLELDSSIDRNRYVDRILDVVLAKAGQRRIVFSCFDPDICTMLRYKQNMYPVMFLTLGVTEKYPQYHDPRCNTIESAVSNAYAMELLGIVAHTEDLLRDSSQINMATDLGLIIFCWGDDNNSQDTIKLLKELGVHGVIYDKMDVLSTKEVKKSMFLVGAKDSQTDLLRLQELEKKRIGGGPAEAGEGTVADSVHRQLRLLDERNRVALSTATSVESLFVREPKDSV